VLGGKRNTVWRYKKSSRDKILSGKEWQRHRTPPGVNETFRCLIINSGTELNATPILLGSRTIFSLSLSLLSPLSPPYPRQLENSVVARRGKGKRWKR